MLSYDTAVVGAGVSGCACASILADAGLSVLLISSALDVVGLPAYGPVLALGRPNVTRASTVFESLPARLGDVWLRDARRAKNSDDIILIDRRAVSLRSKWLLEGYPNVSLRQALITSVQAIGELRAVGWVGPLAGDSAGVVEGDRTATRVRLLTGFGEELGARACVLAVGLGLGGRTRVGFQDLPGGRHGEVPADALAQELFAAGLPREPVRRLVGSRLTPVRGAGSPWDSPSGSPLPDASVEQARLRGGAAGQQADELVPLELVPVDLRGIDSGGDRLFQGMTEVPSPYEQDAPTPATALLRIAGGEPAGGIFPDGHVSGQWYGTPGMAAQAGAAGFVVAQPEHQVSGFVIRASESELAAFGLGGVWVAGQAAGAEDYLAALESAVAVATEVTKYLREHPPY